MTIKTYLKLTRPNKNWAIANIAIYYAQPGTESTLLYSPLNTKSTSTL